MAPLAGAIPPNPSPSLGVILKWLQSVADNDIATMETALAAEYTQQCLPKSLGWPAFEKGNYLDFMTKMLAKFDDFEVSHHEGANKQGEADHGGVARSPSTISWRRRELPSCMYVIGLGSMLGCYSAYLGIPSSPPTRKDQWVCRTRTRRSSQSELGKSTESGRWCPHRSSWTPSSRRISSLARRRRDHRSVRKLEGELVEWDGIETCIIA